MGRAGRVDRVDRRFREVRAGLWDLWDRVDQLRRLCLDRPPGRGDRVGRHRLHLRVRRAQSVGFERGCRDRLGVRRYQLDLVGRVGRVVRVVQVEHRYLDDQVFLDLRGLQVGRGDQVGQVDPVDTVCTAVE